MRFRFYSVYKKGGSWLLALGFCLSALISVISGKFVLSILALFAVMAILAMM